MSYRIISADSHFVEPPNMWGERMDKKFRDHVLCLLVNNLFGQAFTRTTSLCSRLMVVPYSLVGA